MALLVIRAMPAVVSDGLPAVGWILLSYRGGREASLANWDGLVV
jgi:hypothetical protein